MDQKQKTAKLETISEIFDIPLWTLRGWSAKRRFPGIIKKGRSIYVEVAEFERWFLSHKVMHKSKDDIDHGTSGTPK
jgi:hypothetical protein